MRVAPLLLLAALAGCASPPVSLPTAPTVKTEAAPAGTCSIGADGGIPVTDRGIGGTGIQADRGIGGTGAYADRGIGGTGPRTGIVGVITGFASVCLAGQEVQYTPGQQVLVDGRAAGPEALRAGQVAAIEAVGGGPRPVAVTLMVRHEVSGPVERIEPDGALRVAGQRVTPPPPAPGAAAPPSGGWLPGTWVMVSGFHLLDGSIAATRLDARGPGEVLIRGIMRSEQGRLWIGLTEVRPGRFQLRQTGIPVLAVGRLNDGVLEADSVEADGLLLDPGVFFGPRVGVLIVEGYAEGGGFWFGQRRLGAGFAAGRALARMERGPGGFAPAFVRPYGPGAGFQPRGFAPAPMPNRAFDRAGGQQRSSGRGEAQGQRRQERRGQDEPQASPNGGQQGNGPGSSPGGSPGGGFFRR